MESIHKSKGFIKGNKMVMALYQAAKPSSTTVKYSSKAIPSQSSSVPSVGFYHVDHPPKQYIDTPEDIGNESFYPSDEMYSYGESIDDMATSYISCMQERFRLERVD